MLSKTDEIGNPLLRTEGTVTTSDGFVAESTKKANVMAHQPTPTFWSEFTARLSSCDNTPSSPLHDDKGSNSCDECGEEFSDEQRLNFHQRLHGEKESKCPRSFKQKSGLSKHMAVHFGENKYSCDICDRKFCRSESVVEHRRTHTGERPFSCPECSVQFARRASLWRHKQTHSEEKLFTCEICDKKFTSARYLKSHRGRHTTEMPSICPQWPTRFENSDRLLMHERIHSEGKQFTCERCDRKFLLLSNLKSHRRIHAEENLHSCSETLATNRDNSEPGKHSIAHEKTARKSSQEITRPMNLAADRAPDQEWLLGLDQGTMVQTSGDTDSFPPASSALDSLSLTKGEPLRSFLDESKISPAEMLQLLKMVSQRDYMP